VKPIVLTLGEFRQLTAKKIREIDRPHIVMAYGEKVAALVPFAMYQAATPAPASPQPAKTPEPPDADTITRVLAILDELRPDYPIRCATTMGILRSRIQALSRGKK
jgi:hypothetical protein